MSEAQPSLEREWDRATEHPITDHDIERARGLLGYDEASGQREYIQTATIDNIRSFVLGYGDDNPLYCDPDYARRTRWGGVTAPGVITTTIGSPLRGDPRPEAIKALRKGLFRGVHSLHAGTRRDWYRPIYPGDTLYRFGGEESVEVKTSAFAGRSLVRVQRMVRMNQRAEVVVVERLTQIMSERKAAAKKGKYAAVEPHTYTEESLAEIDEIYANEQVRGAATRYWEDILEGESLGTMAKGPLTLTDIICFHAGGFGFAPYAPSAARVAYKNRMNKPLLYIKNEHGIPDNAQRMHWDSHWAQKIGSPMAYDYGYMRECYIHHFLTDWCGDEGVVVSMSDEVRKFGFLGDVQVLTGEVVAKREEGGRALVDVVARLINQRDETTTTAAATIALPSRKLGPARYPHVPDDLQAKAVEMMARHHALS